MDPDSDLYRLASWMAGEFENRAQAKAEPVWYPHIRVWQRPVQLFDQGIALFLEQASALSLDRPYRQRLLHLSQSPTAAAITGQYYALTNPGEFQGASRDLERLRLLQLDSLERLPTCRLTIACQPGSQRFEAQAGEELCSFTYGGQQRFVQLGFTIRQSQGETELQVHEKGVDPSTGKGLWGALMGPFKLIKDRQYELG